MYDLMIENARICDGTGKPSFHGNVAVKDGMIAAVGKGTGETATKKINADGLVRYYHRCHGQVRRWRRPGPPQGT